MLFYDSHITGAVFPVGLWYCVKNLNDERIFGAFLFILVSPFARMLLFNLFFSHFVRHYRRILCRRDDASDTDFVTRRLRIGGYRFQLHIRGWFVIQTVTECIHNERNNLQRYLYDGDQVKEESTAVKGKRSKVDEDSGEDEEDDRNRQLYDKVGESVQLILISRLQLK